jgi:hypothetical protein
MPYVLLCQTISSQSGIFLFFSWSFFLSFGAFFFFNDGVWVNPVWVADAVSLTIWIACCQNSGAFGQFLNLGGLGDSGNGCGSCGWSFSLSKSGGGLGIHWSTSISISV